MSGIRDDDATDKLVSKTKYSINRDHTRIATISLKSTARLLNLLNNPEASEGTHLAEARASRQAGSMERSERSMAMSFAYNAFGRITQTTFPSTLKEIYLYNDIVSSAKI